MNRINAAKRILSEMGVHVIIAPGPDFVPSDHAGRHRSLEHMLQSRVLPFDSYWAKLNYDHKYVPQSQVDLQGCQCECSCNGTGDSLQPCTFRNEYFSAISSNLNISKNDLFVKDDRELLMLLHSLRIDHGASIGELGRECRLQ